MKLIRYGITLNRLTFEDLELIRQWRNSEKIRRNMIFREEITPEMQQEWFRSIDNYNNFFYIIEYNGEKIGLIDNKGTDWQAGSTQSGLFIYEEKYRETHIPVAASLILMQIGYGLLNVQETRIKVLKDNQKALNYNLYFGFEICRNNPDEIFVEMIQRRESFFKKTNSLHHQLVKLTKDKDPYLYLYLEPHDYLNGVAQGVLNEMNKVEKSKIIWEKHENESIQYCMNI